MCVCVRDRFGEAGYMVSIVALKNIAMDVPLLMDVATEQCWVLVKIVSAALSQVHFRWNWGGSHS